MAIMTTIEQLEEVQAAISRCLVAQQVGSANNSLMRARLDFLQQREAVLLRRYQEEQASAGAAGGMFNKVKFAEVQ